MAASAQWRTAIDQLRPKFPKLADMLEMAKHDVLAYMASPSAHCVQLCSTNLLARLNAEVKRRTNVIGTFPNEHATIRLVGVMILVQNDEWSLQRRYVQLDGQLGGGGKQASCWVRAVSMMLLPLPGGALRIARSAPPWAISRWAICRASSMNGKWQ